MLQFYEIPAQDCVYNLLCIVVGICAIEYEYIVCGINSASKEELVWTDMVTQLHVVFTCASALDKIPCARQSKQFKCTVSPAMALGVGG